MKIMMNQHTGILNIIVIVAVIETTWSVFIPSTP